MRNKPKIPKLITLSHAVYINGAIMPVEEVSKIKKDSDGRLILKQM
jgi:selenocysteine lyase/cysteine desulfurase